MGAERLFAWEAATMARATAWGFYHRVMAEGREAIQVERRTGWTRPVSIPDDIDDPQIVKATGVIVLPDHVSWSGPKREWDVADRHQRAQVYEIVLTEGTEGDVRRFIDVDELLALWDDLWLSPHVRVAWARHLGRLRGVQLAC